MTHARVFSKVSLLAALMVTVAFGAPMAEAKWFGKDKNADEDVAKQIQTFQPPPADALEMYCDPLRKEAAELKAKTPRTFRVFVQPRRAMLMRKHEKCKAEYMRQEHQYLKHVDVQQSPSLPKLKIDETSPSPASAQPPQGRE